MKRQNKYQYLRVIQGLYGGRWCDIAAYDANDIAQSRALRADLKTYRENERVPFRVISRRMLATEQFHA